MNAEFFNARFGTHAGQGRFRHKFVVTEGHAGLLYRHGVFVRLINAGRHVLWGFGWSVNMMDLRKADFGLRVSTSLLPRAVTGFLLIQPMDRL